jgi:hypothetical protein
MDDIKIDPVLYQQRELHPQGPFAAVCVDIIDLGMRVKDFQGKKKAAHTCALVFSTGKASKEGYSLDLSQEFTISLHEKATMTKFLEAWRGQVFSEEEKGSSFSLMAFAKKPGLISVVHRKSKDGSKTYANIGAIMPLPEGMKVPDVVAYERPPYFAKRKEQYAAEFAAYMSAPPEVDEDNVPF